MIIYKYKLEPDLNEIEMPLGAKFLDVQVQDGVPCIWMLVNETNPKVKRKFVTIGTGWKIDEPEYYLSKYCGTFQLVESGLIFHLFDLGESRS